MMGSGTVRRRAKTDGQVRKSAQQTPGLQRQKAPAAAKYSGRPHTATTHRSQENLRQ